VRRGRYRADRLRPAEPVTGYCWDCQWLGRMIETGRHTADYTALLVRHFQSAHEIKKEN
jgi:hypothetical protein